MPHVRHRYYRFCLPRAWTILAYLYLFCGDLVSSFLPHVSNTFGTAWLVAR